MLVASVKHSELRKMDFELIWFVFIAASILLFVLLDGVDTGVGILTGRARSNQHWSLMLGSIEPLWDGDEAWLGLGIGSLILVFPLAFTILLTALFFPVSILIAALVMRLVAFTMCKKNIGQSDGNPWNHVFKWASITVAFFQGVILGAFIQGISIEGRIFSGANLDWLTPFSFMAGLSLIAGNSLLGATWLVLKLNGEYQEVARGWARQSLVLTAVALCAVSLATLSIDPRVTDRWGITMYTIDFAQFLPLAIIPLIATFLIAYLWKDLDGDDFTVPPWRPYVSASGIFACGYLGIAVSLYPFAIPFQLTMWEASANGRMSTSLQIVVAIVAVIVLAYGIYIKRRHWGKVSED